MLRPLPVILLSLSLGLFLSACSTTQQTQPEETASHQEKELELPPPLYLGTVHQVFTADKFALLRLIGPRPAEGTVLITHPADGSTERMGNLLVSSAQHARNSIIAADIRAGVVMKGDRVFQYRSIAATQEEEEQETPEPTTLTDTEIDLGFTPPEFRNQETQSTATEQSVTTDTASNFIPAAETSVLPTEEPIAPSLPEPPARGHLDDIPDNINDWDSM
jgi:hypothetical protein